MTQIEEVYQSLAKFLAPMNLEEIYQYAVEEAKKLTRSDFGSIFLANEQGELERIYSTVPTGAQMTPRAGGTTQKAFEERKSYIISTRTISKYHPKVKVSGVKSIIFIPLSYENKPVGVLTMLSTKPRHFAKKKFNLLKLYGTIVTLRIRNAELLKQKTEALQTRDLFISMASHELKTPLTTITVYSHLINNSVQQKIIPPVKWAKALEEEVLQLKMLVNELLETNQITQGKITLKLNSIDLRAILDRSISNFKTTFPQHAIKYKRPTRAIQLDADGEKLIQVFNNVFNNAGKFSPAKFPIIVDVTKQKNHVTISIADKGHGIPKKDLNHIFNRYQRGSNAKKEGMGLGLFICKTIIEDHQGTIDIDSKINTGTTVHISLPL